VKTNDIYAPASDGSPVEWSTSDVGIRTRQLECMRAFQTGRSWYEAYWFPEPQPRRPGIVSRTLATLVLLFESRATPQPAERITEPRLVIR
jgi:hypothetical protein